VLVDDGGVTGVLDWPNALVADPAFDVASTLNILRSCGRVTSMRPRCAGARLAQPLLAVAISRPIAAAAIDDARLAYYQVAAALRALCAGGEPARLAGPPTDLDASPYARAPARLLPARDRQTR